MVDWILENYNMIIDLMRDIGIISGFSLMIIEAIFPVLPLTIFIAMNVTAFGFFAGYIISWIGVICGGLISFFTFRKFFSERLYRKIEDKDKLNDLMKWIGKVKFPHLVVLVSLPFTPGFLFNAAAGLSEIKFRKFFFAILIGKIFVIYFWGYIGYNLIEMLQNPKELITVVIMLVLAYFISKYVGKKLNIDD